MVTRKNTKKATPAKKASTAKKEKELENELRSLLGISAKVRLVAPESIARSEGKAKRVIDKRLK